MEKSESTPVSYTHLDVYQRQHIGDAPEGIVLADDGYLVAAAQLSVLENKMQSGYFLCHFAISIALVFAIVGIAGEVPILAETMLV